MTAHETVLPDIPMPVPQAELVVQALRKNLQHIEAVAAADHVAWRPLALIPAAEEPPVLRKGYSGDIAESPANVAMLALLCTMAGVAIREGVETTYTYGDGSVHTSRTRILERPGGTDIYLREVVSVTDSWTKSRVTIRNFAPNEPETFVGH